MANVNRWIEGERNTVLVGVVSGVTVEMGDLMFLDDADSLRDTGTSTVNYLAYPIAYLRGSGVSLITSKENLKSHFLGVAVSDKDSITGGTEVLVSVAKSGKFKFGLKPNKTVHIGEMFSAAGTTVDSIMFNQLIAKTTNSTMALGYITQRKLHAQSVEVFIRSAYGPEGGVA